MSWLEAPIRTRRLTPDEVLERLNDWFESCYWREPLSEREPDWACWDRSIRLEDLIVELDEYYDGKADAESAAEVIQVIFGPGLPDDELVAILRSNGDIGSLCDFVAEWGEIERVDPARIMGQVSWEAGLFRVLRAVLRREGVDVHDVAPSTRLSPYLLEDAGAFERVMNRLAPGRAPALRHVYPFRADTIAFTLLLTGYAGLWLLPLTIWGLVPLIFLPVFPVALVCLVVGFLVGRIKPKEARLGELATFGDLVSALAVHYRGSRLTRL